MGDADFRCFEFGEFRLDVQRRRLERSGNPVHLKPRSFDLLCVLVQNAGQVLGHDQLLEQVWAGTFVEPGNLKKAVFGLRQALGESPGDNQFVTTVPRQGYRFSAPVRLVPPSAILVRETTTEVWVNEEVEDTPSATAPAGLASTSPRPVSARVRRLAGAGGALLLLGAAALITWPYFRSRPRRFSVENVQVTRLMADNHISEGAISADGSLYVSDVVRGAERSLWVRQVTTGSAVQVVAPINGSFWAPTFAPDNSFVYYTFKSRTLGTRDGIYRVPALGGVPPQLLAEGVLLGLKVSPDGKRLAAYRTVNEGDHEIHQLLTLAVDGGDERIMLTLPPFSLLRGIAWSPDGSSLLYGVKQQTPTAKPVHYIAELPLAGGNEKILLPAQDKLLYVEAWMPDRSSILLREREQHSEAYQVWQFFPATGEMAPITHDDYTYGSVGLAQNGETLSAFRSFALASVWESDADAGNFRQIATGINSGFDLDWTPDGQLVFATTENEREYVGVMNVNGGQKRLLTDGEDGVLLHPRISGDGRYFTYTSNRSGSRQVWRRDLDGRAPVQVTQSPTGAGKGILLADGQTVIYSTYRPSSSIWYLVRQTGAGTTNSLTETDSQDWDVSPDQKLLAVQLSATPDHPGRIELRDLTNGAVVRSFPVQDAESIRWTRDGKALTYVRSGDDREELVWLPVDGGPERVITNVNAERLAQFSWSADGRRLAIVRSKLQFEAVLFRAQMKK